MKMEILIEINMDLGYPMMFISGLGIDEQTKNAIVSKMFTELCFELKRKPYYLSDSEIDKTIKAMHTGATESCFNASKDACFKEICKEYDLIMQMLNTGALCIPGYACYTQKFGPFFFHGILCSLEQRPSAANAIYRLAINRMKKLEDEDIKPDSKWAFAVEVDEDGKFKIIRDGAAPKQDNSEQDVDKQDDTIKLLVRELKGNLAYGEQYRFEILIPDIAKKYAETILDIVTYVYLNYGVQNNNPVYEMARAIWEDGALSLDFSIARPLLRLFENPSRIWKRDAKGLPNDLCKKLNFIYGIGYTELVEMWKDQGKPDALNVPYNTEPKFKEGDIVYASRKWLADREFDECDILSWFKKAVQPRGEYSFTVQKVEEKNGTYYYLLDRFLCETWMPEEALAK